MFCNIRLDGLFVEAPQSLSTSNDLLGIFTNEVKPM